MVDKIPKYALGGPAAQGGLYTPSNLPSHLPYPLSNPEGSAQDYFSGENQATMDSAGHVHNWGDFISAAATAVVPGLGLAKLAQMVAPPEWGFGKPDWGSWQEGSGRIPHDHYDVTGPGNMNPAGPSQAKPGFPGHAGAMAKAQAAAAEAQQAAAAEAQQAAAAEVATAANAAAKQDRNRAAGIAGKGVSPTGSDVGSTEGGGTPFRDGGYVYGNPRNYAEGGMNISGAAPGGAQISEQDFMGILAGEAGGAGIPEEMMQALIQNIPGAAAGAQQQAPTNDNIMGSGIMETVEVEEGEPEIDSGIAQLPAISEQLVAMGEEPLVQATTGEIIFDPRLLDESQQRMLFASLEAAGIDPNTITVGAAMPISELTGLPAAGIGKFFKKIGKSIKKVGKFLKKNAGTILGIAGAMTGNPWMAALGSGIGSLIEGKGIQSALMSAGLSYAGAEWVGPWIGEQVSAATSGLSETFPETFGGLGEFFQAPTGEGISSILPGGMGGEAIAGTTAAAAGKQGVAGAGWRAALEAFGQGAPADVAQNAAQQAMYKAAGGEAIMAGVSAPVQLGAAKAALQKALPDISAKAITGAAQKAFISGGKGLAQVGLNSLIAQGPSSSLLSQAAGGPIQNILAQSVADTVGDVGSAALIATAKPMLEEYYNYPTGDEDAARRAFEEQYNYTPSSDELYTFYVSSFNPQQATVGQLIGGTSGYAGLPVLTAAGGGYINGIGGPKTDSNLARLSDGEFVMTEKSVRGAGNGDRMKGAAEMYRMMNGLERRVA